MSLCSLLFVLLAVPTQPVERRPLLIIENDPHLPFDDNLVIVGDVDGGGVPDFVLGSRTALPSGVVQLRSGEDGRLLGVLDNPRRFVGLPRPIGDVDGDGAPDFADGNPADVIYSGADLGVILDLHGLGELRPGVVGDLDGDGSDEFIAETVSTQAWVIRDLDLSTPLFTLPFRFYDDIFSVADRTGDGLRDLVFGIEGDSELFVIPGRIGVISSSTGLPLWLASRGQSVFFGKRVLPLGDQDQSGQEDILVADFQLDVASGGDGQSLGVLPVSGFPLRAGDRNGDGVEDILIGGASGDDFLVRIHSGAAISQELSRFTIPNTQVEDAVVIRTTGELLVLEEGASRPDGRGRIEAWDADLGLRSWEVQDAGPRPLLGTDVAVGRSPDGDRLILAQPAVGPNRVRVFDESGLEVLESGDLQPDGMTAGEYALAVAAVDDLNGDGFDEILIGNPRHDVAGGRDEGRVELRDGQSGGLLQAHEGTAPRVYAGLDVVGLDDVDGDDVPDYAYSRLVDIGALGNCLQGGNSLNPCGQGQIVVISGATGQVVRTLDAAEPDSELGFRLARIDDLDRDGVDDLAAGQVVEDAGQPVFEVLLLSGVDLGEIRALSVPILASSRHHFALGDAGDINGDGYGDIIAGVSFGTSAFGRPVGITGTPRVVVFSGRDGAELVSRTDSHSGFGRAVNGVGDVDGDGHDDYAVGNPLTRALSGELEVFSGQTGELLDRITGTPAAHLGQAVAGTRRRRGVGSGSFVVTAPQHRASGGAFQYTSAAARHQGFVDLGGGLAGQGGLTPALRIRGSFRSGEQASVTAHRVRPGAAGFLAIGSGEGTQALWGGTFVPQFPVVLIAMVSDAEGDATLTGSLGADLDKIQLVAQALFLDGDAPQGVSLSNAVRMFLP